MIAKRGGNRRPCDDKPRCRHCGVNSQCRARDLCWPCSKKPEVRRLYPVESKFGKHADVDRVVSTEGGMIRLDEEPTPALPGTQEKILVMGGRAERGVQLFHPEDGPACGVARREPAKVPAKYGAQILEILERGSARGEHVAKILGVGYFTACSYMGRMEKAGLLRKVARGVWSLPGEETTSWGLDFEGWFGGD